MYWNTNDQWPAYLFECVVAYRNADAPHEWLFERALPSPKTGIWYSLEEPDEVISNAEYWLELDDPC